MGTPKRWFSLRQRKQKPRRWAKPTRKSVKRLKVEMKKVREEQESIREGQRQVGTKIEAINQECEQLRWETNQIIRQSANTQLRLFLMFNILKAREQADFPKAHQLTALLREMVGRNDC